MTVGELCQFQSGTGFGPADWSNSGLPIIRIQNLNGSREFNYFSGTPDPSWLVNPGDLLFAWAGVKGVSFGPTIWNGPHGVLNQHIYRVHPVPQVNLKWLHFQLQHVTSTIESNAHGFKSSLVHVRKSDITGQVCLVPSICEQELIVSFVSAWDRGIQQLSDLIAAKVRFKQGLMQQLLTGKKRFSDFRVSKGFHCTPFGKIPLEWDVIPLNHIVKEVKRKNTDGAKRVLTASGTRGLVDQQEYFNRRVASDSLDKYFLLKKGEFAYNRSLMKGYPYGATKRLDDYDSGVLSTLYLCFQVLNEQCNSDFLVLLFEGGILNSQLRSIARMGARAHGLLNVNASEFFEMVIPLPSAKEQEQIAGCFRSIDTELDSLRRKLDVLKQQKKGLMQKLLTGEIRVKPHSGSV